MTTRLASCSCGQLSVACEGEPVRISMCHCLACQRRTGGTFGVQARFPRDKVAITGESTAYVRIGDSGNSASGLCQPDDGNFNFPCQSSSNSSISINFDATVLMGGAGTSGRPYTVLRWRDGEAS